MVKRNWSLCALSAGMSFLLSVTSMMCLLTAFELEASLLALVIWSLVGAALWSICYSIPHSLIPLGIYALSIGYLWRSGDLSEGIESLLFSVTTVYNSSHGWDISGTAGSADSMLCLLAVLITLFAGRSICKGRSRLLPVLCCILPLIPCFVAEEAMPDPLWLGLWIFGISLFLLTQPARRQKGSEKLTALLAVPVAAFAVLVLVLLPQSGQEQPKALAQELVDLLQEMGIGTPVGKPMKVGSGAVELKKLGPRQESQYPVMTVTSDRGGTLYLRGCAYDTYFQNNWTNLTLIEDMYWPDEADLEDAGTVTIQTEYVLEMRYFPYYVTDGSLTNVSRGINNFSKQTTYSYSTGVLKTQQDSYTYVPNHGYTQTPTVVSRWAEPVVERLITSNMTDREKIAVITEYVKGLAKYSLYAERMPAEEQDFVVWFAERANKGYCIHFASTGVILLRAAGIPTRYVTGYMVQTEAGAPTQVYGKNAHAWAECFLEGVGWVPVELTPGAEPEEERVVPQPEDRETDLTPLLWILASLPVLAIGTVLLRWRIRVFLRCRKRKKGNDRERLLTTYSQLAELLALMGKKPDSTLQQLAEQAKYSNRPVATESVQLLENALKNAKKALKQQPVFKRLHYRLVLNLY